MKTKRLVTLSSLIAVAMILSYIESLIPVFIPIPGVKLGLSNIASVFTLYTLGAPAAICVSLIRVTLSSLLFGSITSFLYSMSGAILSLVAMCLLHRLTSLSPIGVSTVGGVLHNIGQVAMAALIMDSGAILLYLPVLFVSGTVAGVVIGIAGGILAKRLEKILKL